MCACMQENVCVGVGGGGGGWLVVVVGGGWWVPIGLLCWLCFALLCWLCFDGFALMALLALLCFACFALLALLVVQTLGLSQNMLRAYNLMCISRKCISQRGQDITCIEATLCREKERALV